MKRQRGLVEVAVLATLLFFVGATIALGYQRGLMHKQRRASQANTLGVVLSATQDYAQANQRTFRMNRDIVGVASPLAPTMAELKTLGFLDAAGISLVDAQGRGFVVRLKVEANQSIGGLVYLNGNVLDGKGQPDPQGACAIAAALGDAGVCSSRSNAAMLGNGAMQIANPLNLPAVVGGLVFVRTP